MITVISVLYPNEAIAREEALRYWGDTHGAIAKKVPGVSSYVQFHALPGPDGEPPFLGTATIEFEDEEAFQTATTSPEMAAAVEDVANFADAERLSTMVVRPVTIVG